MNCSVRQMFSINSTSVYLFYFEMSEQRKTTSVITGGSENVFKTAASDAAAVTSSQEAHGGDAVNSQQEKSRCLSAEDRAQPALLMSP